MKVEKRPYRMQARAAAAAATAERIRRVTIELHRERWFDQVTLEDIAGRAGVTVPTVLRHFRSKDELLIAAGRSAEVNAGRARHLPPVGDRRAAVAAVVDEYEQWGDAILRMLHQEDRVPALRVLADEGRAFHADWVQRTFAPSLDERTGAARDRLLAQLIVATDIYTWSLLRRVRDMTRRQAEHAMRDMIEALERTP